MSFEILKDKITLSYWYTTSVWWNRICGYSHATRAATLSWEKILEGKKEKAGVYYRSDSATENCLIILLIKCEPEKNSFFSPRAQLGWQDFKEVQHFHKGKQVCPSVQTDNGSLKTMKSLGALPLTFGGSRNLPWEICWVRNCHMYTLSLQSQITFKSTFYCFYLLASACPIQN